MKICILDTNTVTKGDVSLKPLEQFGEVAYYDMLPVDEVIDAVKDSDVIICNKTRITAEIMDACPNLKFITLFATGYNNIDIVAAAERGIVVSNTPDYSTASVAQHTIAMMLELAENLSLYNASVKRGDWVKSKKFCYFSYPFVELSGKTLGIIGFGTIGQAVAKIALSFGMKVKACARTPKTAEGVDFATKEEVIKSADFLTLHCPLNEGTKGLINRETLALMKPTAYLINTARGGVVEEAALCEVGIEEPGQSLLGIVAVLLLLPDLPSLQSSGHASGPFARDKELGLFANVPCHIRPGHPVPFLHPVSSSHTVPIIP